MISTSRGYTLGTFGAYPAIQGDEINGVIGACSDRQHEFIQVRHEEMSAFITANAAQLWFI